MSRQVTQQKPVKRQYNKPRFEDGKEMPIIESGRDLYSPDELEARARKLGYKHGIQPYEEFLFDSYWATRDPEKRILVSVAGEVAQWFPAKNDYGGGYRILAQEYKQEYLPEQKDLLEELEFGFEQGWKREDLHTLFREYRKMNQVNQKYLFVWLRDNPAVPTSGASHPLHQVVAELHCDITDQIVTEVDDGRFRIKGSLQTEHLDCRKDNNSIHNLRHTTSYINQRMRGKTCGAKCAEYANHEPIGKLWQLRDLLDEMNPASPPNH